MVDGVSKCKGPQDSRCEVNHTPDGTRAVCQEDPPATRLTRKIPNENTVALCKMLAREESGKRQCKLSMRIGTPKSARFHAAGLSRTSAGVGEGACGLAAKGSGLLGGGSSAGSAEAGAGSAECLPGDCACGATEEMDGQREIPLGRQLAEVH